MVGDRTQPVIDTFVELADTLATDYDIGEFLHMLVERCQDVLQVDAGGVLLETAGGGLNLAAATSEAMQRYENAEMDHEEGPCIDAYRGAKQVVAEDLGTAHHRWPHAAPAALELGMRAVYAFPLRLRGHCIGALNLYREHAGPFLDDDVRLAQAFADMAAIGILQAREVSEAQDLNEHLERALRSHVVIEQAKGVLMATTGASATAAFEALRKHARDHRTKLHEVCRRVVERQELPPSA